MISIRKCYLPTTVRGILNHRSCFPIVPKFACEHLRIPSAGGSKPITLLGGLTSFGGAGNNYSMHVSLLLNVVESYIYR